MLQCVGFLPTFAVCCGVSRCVAVCCSALQCVAVCCSVLQCAAVGCSVLQCDEVLSLSTLLSTMGSLNDLVSFAKESFTNRVFFRKSNKTRALFAQKDLAIAWGVPTKGGGGKHL